MKKYTEKRLISFDVIEFKDGEKIDLRVLNKFLEEASEMEDTIGKEGNYTSKYLYFCTREEAKLEPILLKYDVIRMPKYMDIYNSKVGTNDKGFYKYYRYWLSDGYEKFKEELNKLIYS